MPSRARAIHSTERNPRKGGTPPAGLARGRFRPAGLRRAAGPAENPPVGRTNAILLAMGLGAILALSLMMQHVLRVHEEHRQSPIVREIQSNFGARLARPAEYRARDLEKGRVAELVIYPVLGVSRLRLAHDVGAYAWRRVGFEQGLSALVVVCVDLDGERTSFPIPRPYASREARGARRGPAAPSAAARPRPGR